MLLDLSLNPIFIPLFILTGFILITWGRKTLETLSFVIGAVAGGILAYMIFEGLLAFMDINIIIKLIVSAVMIFLGGMVGKGTIVMLLAMAASIVVVDVVQPFESNEILLSIIGLLAFLGLVAVAGRYMWIFAAFFGGVLISIVIGNLLEGSMEEGMLRITQLSIALALCLAGSFIQRYLEKMILGRNEEIVWIPTKNPS